LKMLN